MERGELLFKLAHEASDLVRGLHADGIVKKAVNDFVTSADKTVEVWIRERINALFPDDAILGEEEGLAAGQDGWLWVVDPIDGTVNFMNGFPLYSVSIALYNDGVCLAGAVSNPFFNEHFTAVKGEGAYLNGERITASQLPLEASLALVVPPHRFHDSLERFWEDERRIYDLVSDTRSIGSAALSLCYTACGRCSLYYEWYLHIYDIAAGCLIAQEAGVDVILSQEGGLYKVLAVSAIHSQKTRKEVSL